MTEEIDLSTAPHIQRFTDRHGKVRTYYRHGNFRVSLPLDRGDGAFWQAYEDASLQDPLRGVNGTIPIKRFEPCLRQLAATTAKRATFKGREYSLTMEWLRSTIEQQKFRCALTNLRFSPDRAKNVYRNPYAPSIDRIDCKGGYAPSNCRMVLVAVNIAIGEWGEEQFAEICRAYVANHPPS